MSLSLLSVSLVYQFAAGVANSTIEKEKVGVEWLNTKKMKKLIILLVCGTLLLTSAESQVSMLLNVLRRNLRIVVISGSVCPLQAFPG
jgi:hypothetical protein